VNQVEIRVTSDNQARPGLVAARKDFDEFRTSGVKAGDAVSASMQQMADKVSAAQLRLKRAHEQEAGALRQVIAASNDVDFVRIGGDADKLAAANKRLDDALKNVARSSREVASASRDAGKAQAEFRKAGEDSGKEFSKGASSILGRLGPSGLIAGGVPAAVLAGGVLADGLVAGFGLGLAGLGLAAASQFGQIKNEYAKLGTELKNDSKKIAEPFGQTLLDIRAQISSTFDFFKPALTKASADLAPVVSRFTNTVFGSLRNFEPAIDPIVRGTGRVLDFLGTRLPSVTARLARGFKSLAESVEDNPEALGDLADGASAAAEGILKLIAALNRLYGPAHDSVDWLAELSDKIQRLTGYEVNIWHKDNDKIPDQAQATADAFDATEQAAADLATAQEAAAKAAEEHAKQLERVTDAAYGQLDAQLQLERAVDSSDDSIKAYNEAVKDHGVKSEEAADALLDLRGASLDVAAAARDNALAQQRAAGKTEDLVGANEAARDALRRMADQAKGPARDAILAQIGVLDTLIARLRAVSGTYTANVQVRVSQTGHYSGPPVGANFAFAHGGVTPAAGGGPRGRRTLVGEHGPELVDLAPGSMVHPAGETARMLGQQAGGVARVELVLRSDGGRLADLLLELLQEAVRDRGGLSFVFPEVA
jgi:hypothetical protein